MQRIDITSPLQIGSLKCRNRVFLAPMSGISDVIFRKLAWRFGAGLVFSEMVASEALVNGQEGMKMKAQSAGLPIHAVQIVGCQAKWMALAARMAEANGANLIDINMGCPARRVTSGLSGSALMRDLNHAMTLIEAVTGAVKVPVTLKMRLGWDHDSINAPQLAARAQSAGVSMITIHARTRCQFYKGAADWQAVRKMREATSLPLVVNGDITDTASVKCALHQSRGDAVMLGRACYGAPWLPGALAREAEMEPEEREKTLQTNDNLPFEHFEEMLLHYGVKDGVRKFRKHLGWYLNSMTEVAICTKLRKAMLTSVEPAAMHKMMMQVFYEQKEVDVT